MPAFTIEQLRKTFENAPGNARVSAVQAAKLAVADQLTSTGQPTEAEYKLLARLTHSSGVDETGDR
jgi:hypothetical protein